MTSLLPSSENQDGLGLSWGNRKGENNLEAWQDQDRGENVMFISNWQLCVSMGLLAF